jgi:ABC-type branched-subunit amino acid transport system ATPase component
METLRLFKLEGKENDLARNLSGGQKRKLSVAIAIIGDSKVCVSVGISHLISKLCPFQDDIKRWECV